MTGVAASAAAYAMDLCARLKHLTDVPGTTTRLFLSPATREAHALLRAEMEALGMAVRVDAIGNLRGLYAGTGAGVLLLGSHLDTVPDAGAYDGVLGVAAGLALVRGLAGRRLPYALEVIAFSEEEGVRFRKPFLGSLALVGELTPELLKLRDADGISVREAVRAFGLDADAGDTGLTPGTFAYVELHLEQGPVLEARGLALGVVEAIAGQSRWELHFDGAANHAGTTPMMLRRDALVAAAGWVVAVREYARARAGLVATVGRLEVMPGAANVVPGAVTASLDVRHAEDAVRHQAVEELLDLAARAADAEGVEVTWRETSAQDAVALDEGLRAALESCVRERGLSWAPMVSGAGHDAMIVARAVPAVLLFVRTPAGLSHHPQESVAEDDVAAALGVLDRLLERLAERTGATS